MTPAIAKGSARKRRVWSEFVSYQELAAPSLLERLAHYEIEVLVAVMPQNLPEISELCHVYREAGVALGLWPMIDDHQGRWASTYNAEHYSSFVLRLLSEIDPNLSTTFAIDLEPPIDLLRGLLHGEASSYGRLLRSTNWATGQRVLRDLLETLRCRGMSTIAAANPMLLSDKPGQSGWQWLFGTPIDDFPFHALSFMSYTSLLEGYSRGLVNRELARSILVLSAQSAARQWGSRASVSIGSVGPGALGDERPYRNCSELADDVALVRACGVEDLALFDLSGVLARPNSEAWLSAFAETPAAQTLPRKYRRTRTLKKAIKVGGYGVASYRRLRNALASED